MNRFGFCGQAGLCINHFDLFGLRQVWLHLRGEPYRPLGFVGRSVPMLVPRVRLVQPAGTEVA
jgi:hypothetical protein